MKNKILRVLFVFVVVFATNQASAYYSPSTGRWLSRDPMGEPGFELLGSTSVVPPVGQPAGTISLPQGRLFVRDKIAQSYNGRIMVSAQNLMVDKRRLAEILNLQQARPDLYVFVANDPLDAVDAFGLLKACYQPMDPLGLLYHAYVVLDDGSTVSDAGDNSDASTPGTRCYPAQPDPSCQCPPSNLSACVKKAIDSDTGNWSITHNCGSIVRDAFKHCCLKDPTPWWLIYP